MNLNDITEQERIPILDERIETLRRANTAQNRWYVERDLDVLKGINPRLYTKYEELYKQLNTTN